MLKEDLDGKEILDIGTGSGCIAVSLAKNLPNAKVTALDISKDALEVAKENAKLNNVSIEFIHADIFEYQSDKKYDIIVSNPPYVLESEKPLMKQNVLGFEPELALFVEDDDPLIHYDRIIKFSNINSFKDSLLFLEINDSYSQDLTIRLNNYFYDIRLFKDFQNRFRFIRAKTFNS